MGTYTYAHRGNKDFVTLGEAHNDCDYRASDTIDDVCSRLAFRGTCVEETDATAFKAIVEAV